MSATNFPSTSVRDSEGSVRVCEMPPWRTAVEDLEFPPTLKIHVHDVGPSVGDFMLSGMKRVMKRDTLRTELREKNYGKRLCHFAGTNASVYDVARAAALKLDDAKRTTDVVSKVWRFRSDDDWLNLPLNLRPRRLRPNFECLAGVYRYKSRPEGTLVVDFANELVGGGCFGRGFVQEESMVMQSTDFATTLHKHRERLNAMEVIVYEGVHFDLWWPRHEAAKKSNICRANIETEYSAPMDILAVNAPPMRDYAGYGHDQLLMHFRKHLLIYGVAEKKRPPLILTGLLGGGAFRNNRPLGLLLHLVMQPKAGYSHDPLVPNVIFHHPILASYTGGATTCDLERLLLDQADRLMEDVTRSGCKTISDLVHLVLTANLPLSKNDEDLLRPKRLEPSMAHPSSVSSS